MIITTAEVADAAAEIRGMMTDTATITRTASTDDAHGGTKKGAPTTVASGVPVWLVVRRQRPRDTPVGGETVFTELWNLHFPIGTDIAPRDTVTIGSRTFQVQELANGTISMDDAVIAREVI